MKIALPFFNCKRTCENGEDKYFVIESMSLYKWLLSAAFSTTCYDF